MAGNNKLLAIIMLCFCGCANYTTNKVQGEFLCVTDSKPYADSLYSEWSKEGNAINPRYIELQYVIHNYTDEEMYLPVQTRSDSTATSHINVYLLDKGDTIRPIIYTKKVPYNSNLICKGDSMTLFIEIRDFEKWSKKGINVNTSVDSLINRIHVEYIKSDNDKKEDFDIPDIEFGVSPQFYYEVPRDMSTLKLNKVKRDRVLVRVSQQNWNQGIGSSDYSSKNNGNSD